MTTSTEKVTPAVSTVAIKTPKQNSHSEKEWLKLFIRVNYQNKITRSWDTSTTAISAIG